MNVDFEHVYYDKGGNQVGNENDALAKLITSKNGIKQYFIMANGSSLYDPQNIEPLYNKKRWAMAKVTSEKFDTYVRYLMTGRKVHLTRAERL